MKRSVILEYALLERLAEKPEYINLIIGTGALARDMRSKLLLLGLNAPFLIGNVDDIANNVRHYGEVTKLTNPKRYRFIVCCDIEEWTLIGTVLPIAYKFLGNATFNHPQLIRFHADTILYECAGEEVIDAVSCNVILSKGRPFATYGNVNNYDSFHIHILGSCHAGGILRFCAESFPELLHQELCRAEFSAVIHTWGQPKNPSSDSLVRFIRDVCFYKTDLVILYNNGMLDPLSISTRNTIATRAEAFSGKHPFITLLDNDRNTTISNGINHDIDLISILVTQHRVFSAISRKHGFTFWNFIPPTHSILPEEQARKLRGLSLGYLSRQRRRKEDAVSAMGKTNIKDYSDTFINIDDISDMFADWGHLSSEGNRLVAKRCATEILHAFHKPSEN